MQRVDTTVAVETPERVSFRHRVAGPGVRALAYVVDRLCQACAMLVAIVALVGVTASSVPSVDGIGTGVLLVIAFVVSWFYGAAFEWWWSGQTPGKRLFGIRAVRRDGSPISGRDAVLRNLLRGVDELPALYAIGVLVALPDARFRRVGDLVADTMVVTETDTDLLPEVPIEPPVTEEERELLPLGVELSREERRVIASLLRRASSLSPRRVEELSDILAPAISAKTGVEASTSLRILTLAYARAAGRV